MNIRVLIAALIAGGTAGCAYPASSINQGTEAGHLKFAGPAGATIRIDGVVHGALAKDHPVVVDVPPGRHRVEEIIGDRSILDRNYEVGAGSTLDIGG
jgi:hypothetical protein